MIDSSVIECSKYYYKTGIQLIELGWIGWDTQLIILGWIGWDWIDD